MELVLEKKKKKKKSKKKTEPVGLWRNIHNKRARGERPARPGEKGYPDPKTWKKLKAKSESVIRQLVRETIRENVGNEITLNDLDVNVLRALVSGDPNASTYKGDFEKYVNNAKFCYYDFTNIAYISLIFVKPDVYFIVLNASSNIFIFL